MIEIAGEMHTTDAETTIKGRHGWPPLIILNFNSTKVHTNNKLNSYTMTLTGSCMCGGIHYSADGSFIEY